jgi:predicted SAM-dependent methyltransferase
MLTGQVSLATGRKLMRSSLKSFLRGAKRKIVADKHLFYSEFYDQATHDAVKAFIASAPNSSLGYQAALFHARRMAITVQYMKKFGLYQENCLEIGSLEYISAKAIWSFFPGAAVFETTNDLRREPFALEDNSIDNLICLEVLEHISDQNYKQATVLDGVFFFLEEAYRVLRIGGKALITTPNAASFWAMTRIFLQNSPMMYDWHFREYTTSELEQIVKSVGFEILAHNTEFVWYLWNFEPLVAFVKEQNFTLENRGDDQFLVIQKPDERIRKAHDLKLPTGLAY